MGVRLKNYNTNVEIQKNQEYLDSTREQRETTVDGYTFHWGPNEVRNFLDDGVGLAHAAFQAGPADTQQNTIPFNDSRS